MLRKRKPAPNVQSVETVTAPIGGLNVRDPLSLMPATDAYELINWVPQQYGIKVRKGFSQWRDTGANEVKSIMSYFSGSESVPSGSFSSSPIEMPGAMFAATDTDIWDVKASGAGAAVSAIALSGNSEAGRFSYINFTNPAGNSFILACSEADGYFTYDGAAWLKVTLGGGATQVSGVDPANLVHVSFWKSRVWFAQRSSPKVWYLGTNSLYGAATAFDLGPLLKRGGGIAWIAAWTIDAGEGIDDLIVFCSENGELLVFKGTDPASATSFGLVGRWEVGQIPKGRRGYQQMGGDLLVLSTLGISPLSYVTRGGAQILSASQQEYTSKIAPLFNQQLLETFNTYGWGLHTDTREGLLLVTAPGAEGEKQQFAMNIANGSWTKFDGIDICSLGSAGGWSLFGATNGWVYLLFSGEKDNVDIVTGVGVNIEATVLPAFNHMKTPAQEKHFLMSKLLFLATDVPALYTTISVDFQTSPFLNTPALSAPTNFSVWDTADWDIGVWGGALVPFEVMQNTPGLGNYGSLGIVVSAPGSVVLTAITYVFETGGVM